MARSRRRKVGRIVTGVDEVDRMLRTISRTGTANRIARATLRPALSEMVRAARRLAPKKSLKRSVRKINKLSKSKKVHQAKVGVNVGLRPGDERAVPHAHLYILGTGLRFRGNRLRPTERPHGRRGRRGKRGIGGRYAFMEPLKPQDQHRRRTGRVAGRASFIRRAADAVKPRLPKIMTEAYIQAAKKEADKVRKKARV